MTGLAQGNDHEAPDRPKQAGSKAFFFEKKVTAQVGAKNGLRGHGRV
jgi:hypothetical protein